LPDRVNNFITKFTKQQALTLMCSLLIIPICHLDTNEHANHKNKEFNKGRKPVCSFMCLVTLRNIIESKF